MSHPKPETVAIHGLKVPSDFDRKSFSKLMVKAHAEEEIEIVETVAFLEPHASGLEHHNCLVRAKKSFRLRACPLGPCVHVRTCVVNNTPADNITIDRATFCFGFFVGRVCVHKPDNNPPNVPGIQYFAYIM